MRNSMLSNDFLQTANLIRWYVEGRIRATKNKRNSLVVIEPLANTTID